MDEGLTSARGSGRGLSGGDRLGISPKEMRALGYRTIDVLVDLLTDADAPAMRHAGVAELRRLRSTIILDGAPGRLRACRPGLVPVGVALASGDAVREAGDGP